MTLFKYIKNLKYIVIPHNEWDKYNQNREYTKHQYIRQPIFKPYYPKKAEIENGYYELVRESKVVDFS